MERPEAEKAKEIIEEDLMNTEKVQTRLKASKKGLEIIINGENISSIRAAVNSALKMYKLHEEVKKCLKQTQTKKQ